MLRLSALERHRVLWLLESRSGSLPCACAQLSPGLSSKHITITSMPALHLSARTKCKSEAGTLTYEGSDHINLSAQLGTLSKCSSVVVRPHPDPPRGRPGRGGGGELLLVQTSTTPAPWRKPGACLIILHMDPKLRLGLPSQLTTLVQTPSPQNNGIELLTALPLSHSSKQRQSLMA